MNSTIQNLFLFPYNLFEVKSDHWLFEKSIFVYTLEFVKFLSFEIENVDIGNFKIGFPRAINFNDIRLTAYFDYDTFVNYLLRYFNSGSFFDYDYLYDAFRFMDNEDVVLEETDQKIKDEDYRTEYSLGSNLEISFKILNGRIQIPDNFELKIEEKQELKKKKEKIYDKIVNKIKSKYSEERIRSKGRELISGYLDEFIMKSYDKLRQKRDNTINKLAESMLKSDNRINQELKKIVKSELNSLSSEIESEIIDEIDKYKEKLLDSIYKNNTEYDIGKDVYKKSEYRENVSVIYKYEPFKIVYDDVLFFPDVKEMKMSQELTNDLFKVDIIAIIKSYPKMQFTQIDKSGKENKMKGGVEV